MNENAQAIVQIDHFKPKDPWYEISGREWPNIPWYSLSGRDKFICIIAAAIALPLNGVGLGGRDLIEAVISLLAGSFGGLLGGTVTFAVISVILRGLYSAFTKR